MIDRAQRLWRSTQPLTHSVGCTPGEVVALRRAALARIERIIASYEDALDDTGLWLLRRGAYVAVCDMRDVARDGMYEVPE